ncbi:MAG: tripartite tricarboxylate transporter substrate-binding protein [Pirellulales bacterium]
MGRHRKTKPAAMLLIALTLCGCGHPLHREPARFPNQPIKVIVYTGPGGMIDTTARRFTQIASKYTDATFVVENRPGAGGMVAMKRVLEMPADGHTLYACTRSSISAIVASQGKSYLPAMDWIGMLMADPECIIVRRQADVNSWKTLVDDARARAGRQIWLGPDMGGLDHVTARKTWKRAGIDARWIPFDSGGKAKAALLAGQGVAYVGNPREVLGNGELKIAALSSPVRIAQFPDVPTFEELGIEGLSHEFMWRGFAVKKGTPEPAIVWYDRLFRQVTADPDWRAFWERGGIDVTYRGRDAFTRIVQEDVREFSHHLSDLGILLTGKGSLLRHLFTGQRLAWMLAAVVLFYLALAAGLVRAGVGERIGYYLIPAILLGACFLLLGVSLTFPTRGDVGPGAVPRLWIGLLSPLTVYLLYQAARRREPPLRRGPRTDRVFATAVLMAICLAGTHYVGYYLSAAVFLAAAMYLLGVRRIPVLIGVSLGWVLAAYWIFARLLHVPLPAGLLAG